MKDLTNKYVNMIEAFECDFVLAKEKRRNLDHLQQNIEDKEEGLLKDIELLEELSYGLRHGFLKIYDVRSTENDSNKNRRNKE